MCSLVEVVIKEPEIEILEKIKIARGKNKDVVRVVEENRSWSIMRRWMVDKERVGIERREGLYTK